MSISLPSTTNATVASNHDEIAQCARELWTDAGHPEGHDDEFWFAAEERLLMARQVPNVSAAILAPLAQPVTRTYITKNTAPEKVRRQR